MILSKITSIKVTFIGLVFLVLSLLAGVVLSTHEQHIDALRSLSRQLPLTWFLNEGSSDIVVTTWFILLCAGAILFFIHLVLCVGTRLYHRLTRNALCVRQWCFIILHAMFILVMLCHGLSMVIGYKISDIQMMIGDRFDFDDTYELSLSDIQFVDDPTILITPYPKRRKRMTRETMHRQKNTAQIVLKDDGRIVTRGRLAMLSPIRTGSTRITLTDFFISDDAPGASIGVKLVITRNPIVSLFFSAYAVLILVFGIYVVLNWREYPSKNQTILERN